MATPEKEVLTPDDGKPEGQLSEVPKRKQVEGIISSLNSTVRGNDMAHILPGALWGYLGSKQGGTTLIEYMLLFGMVTAGGVLSSSLLKEIKSLEKTFGIPDARPKPPINPSLIRRMVALTVGFALGVGSAIYNSNSQGTPTPITAEPTAALPTASVTAAPSPALSASVSPNPTTKRPQGRAPKK